MRSFINADVEAEKEKAQPKKGLLIKVVVGVVLVLALFTIAHSMHWIG